MLPSQLLKCVFLSQNFLSILYLLLSSLKIITTQWYLFPFYLYPSGLQARMKISMVCGKGAMYYLDERITPTGFTAGSSNTQAPTSMSSFPFES